jgi:HEAT repeat protein
MRPYRYRRNADIDVERLKHRIAGGDPSALLPLNAHYLRMGKNAPRLTTEEIDYMVESYQEGSLPILELALRRGHQAKLKTYVIRRAVECCGDDIRILGLLKIALGDRFSTVKSAALEAIAGTSDSRDPMYEPLFISEEIATQLDDETVALITDILRSDSSATRRRYAAMVLGRVEHSPSAVGADLAQIAEYDPNERVRDSAMRSLVEMDDPAAFPLLAASGGPGSPMPVLIAVVVMMGNLDDDRVLPYLLDLRETIGGITEFDYLSPFRIQLVAEIAIALSRHGDLSGLDDLILIAEGPPGPYGGAAGPSIARGAINFSPRLADTLVLLGALIGNYPNDPLVLSPALRSLAALNRDNPNILNTLEPYLYGGDFLFRLRLLPAVVEAISMIDHPNATEVLKKFVEESQGREGVSEALQVLRDRGVNAMSPFGFYRYF